MKTLEVGKCYAYRSHGILTNVKKIIYIDGDKVEYERLHGAGNTISKYGKYGRCHWSKFRGYQEIEEKESYQYELGCNKYRNFLVLNTKGKEIFICTEKKAKRFLDKGYATPVSDNVIQFITDNVENKLRELYGEEFPTFFMAEKNRQCCVCGGELRLSRHHVVPQRHLNKVPLELRRFLSNILFLCLACHKRYENNGAEPDIQYMEPEQYIKAWEEHFLTTMKPQHMPYGWKLIVEKRKQNAN